MSFRSAAKASGAKGRDLEREAQNLAAYTKSAYDRRSQDLRMWIAGGIGLLAGALLVLLLPRILPFEADTHVAAIVMGADRVSAGRAIIRAADPEMAHNIEWSSQFYETNAGGIGPCFQKARETGTEQECTITVPAPAQ